MLSWRGSIDRTLTRSISETLGREAQASLNFFVRGPGNEAV